MKRVLDFPKYYFYIVYEYIESNSSPRSLKNYRNIVISTKHKTIGRLRRLIPKVV